MGNRIHEIKLRVRYGETDQMGIVYHGNYAQYMEVGRVEWLRHAGVSYRWMEENGIMLVVASMTIQYKRSAKYDDVLLVKTIIREKPTAKVIFDYEIYREDTDEILITASTVLVFLNAKTRKPMACPDFLMEKFL